MSKCRVQAAMARAWARLPKGGRVVLAVSGGVDSMALLEAAAFEAEKNFESRRLVVAHVNHGLRGHESDADEALVHERASALGLRFECRRLTWKKAPSQDECRREREAFFTTLLSGEDDRLFLGHHLNDQAETVLFRLIRGTGARGLRGIPRVNGKKMRPFLGLSRGELLAWARERGITWREDASNTSLSYERNWLRHVLFPLIEERRPGFQEKLAALAAEAETWKTPAPRLDLFRWDANATFCRMRALPAASELACTFGLGRQHAQGLRALLRKPAGRLEAKGVRFTWSGGVLLAERGTGFAEPAGTGSSVWTSCLGDWRPKEGIRFLATAGQSERKKLKNMKVPIFFRGAVPLALDPAGRCHPLLPEPRPESAVYQPSKLALWWLRRDQRSSTPR